MREDGTIYALGGRQVVVIDLRQLLWRERLSWPDDHVAGVVDHYIQVI